MRFVRCADDGDVAITTELYILIRMLSMHVARRAVAAHQKLEFTVITDGGSAADIGRGPPDHLRVMTAHFPGGTPTRISNRRVFPMILFVGPALHTVGRGIPASAACPKVLSLARSCRVNQVRLPTAALVPAGRR